jgi:hypothetical protein
VTIETDLSLEQEISDRITRIVSDSHIAGIKAVRVNVIPFETGD